MPTPAPGPIHVPGPMPAPAPGPTLADIARAAEVSTATVSHALNGTGRLGESTRRRVRNDHTATTGEVLDQFASSGARRIALHAGYGAAGSSTPEPSPRRTNTGAPSTAGLRS
ncbi:LacI family DNA-binding transcriptional regulator [Streptomyces sp. H34-S4]|uniref:LacI family DNA-binding transcriptional regulator n=1 Tax=Streptomyces sp. H34-S4 TaxID=2996463 RepID=UPI003B63AB85